MGRQADGRHSFYFFKSSFDDFWICSFRVTNVQGDGVILAIFVEVEDTRIHAESPHLFIRMGNAKLLTSKVFMKKRS